MGYTQLAQAKAEKKYPYLKKRYTFHEPVIETQRQAYIDALNDVKFLMDVLENIENGTLNNGYLGREDMRIYAAGAKKQFEKIEH